MGKRYLEDDLKELSSIQRNETERQETFQKIKMTLNKKKSPFKYYLTTAFASLLIVILLFPVLDQFINNDNVSIVEIIEENLIETVSYPVDENNQESFEIIKEQFFNDKKEVDFPFDSKFSPTEYTFVLNTGEESNYYVWTNAKGMQNEIEYIGVFQPVGESAYYELDEHITKILLKDLYEYNIALEETNLIPWNELNINPEQNNSLLENPNFIDNARKGIVDNITPPLLTSAQSLIKNYMGLPDYKSDPAEGIVTLFYKDCQCGFGVNYGYEDNHGMWINNYFVPINLSRDKIVSLIGEPDAEDHSQTGGGYYLYYYNEQGNVYLSFSSDDELSDFTSFKIYSP